MTSSKRIRNIFFILAGLLVLVLKRYYSGPQAELVLSYASNISVSFSIYFIALLAFDSLPQPRLFSALGALLAVEIFELTNGFGVMSNVYDPRDYLANALGITLALIVDLLMDRPDPGEEEKNG